MRYHLDQTATAHLPMLAVAFKNVAKKHACNPVVHFRHVELVELRGQLFEQNGPLPS
jgi:hypothetical protein